MSTEVTNKTEKLRKFAEQQLPRRDRSPSPTRLDPSPGPSPGPTRRSRSRDRSRDNSPDRGQEEAQQENDSSLDDDTPMPPSGRKGSQTVPDSDSETSAPEDGADSGSSEYTVPMADLGETAKWRKSKRSFDVEDPAEPPRKKTDAEQDERGQDERSTSPPEDGDTNKDESETQGGEAEAGKQPMMLKRVKQGKTNRNAKLQTDIEYAVVKNISVLQTQDDELERVREVLQQAKNKNAKIEFTLEKERQDRMQDLSRLQQNAELITEMTNEKNKILERSIARLFQQHSKSSFMQIIMLLKRNTIIDTGDISVIPIRREVYTGDRNFKKYCETYNKQFFSKTMRLEYTDFTMFTTTLAALCCIDRIRVSGYQRTDIYVTNVKFLAQHYARIEDIDVPQQTTKYETLVDKMTTQLLNDVTTDLQSNVLCDAELVPEDDFVRILGLYLQGKSPLSQFEESVLVLISTRSASAESVTVADSFRIKLRFV